MAVSGIPDLCDNHAKCIARLALDMMDMCKNVNMGPNPVVSISNSKSYFQPNISYFQIILFRKFFELFMYVCNVPTLVILFLNFIHPIKT